MARFESEYFDEGKFKQELQALETAEGKFEEAICKLRDEGFPVDYQSVMQMSAFSDNDFLNHVKDLFNKYISSLGFVIKPERKRIADLYNAMYVNSLPYVQTIRESINKGLIIKEQKDGGFKLDRKGIEEQAKKRATISIDTEKMEEYFNLIMGIKEAMAKAEEFENKHNLYKFSDGDTKLIYLNPYYPDFICELTLPQYFKNGNQSAEYFQKMMRQFFEKGV